MVSWKHKNLMFSVFQFGLKNLHPSAWSERGETFSKLFWKKNVVTHFVMSYRERKYLSTQQELDPRASNFAAQFSTTELWKTLFIRVNTFCTAYMKISEDRNWLTACLKLAELTSCRFISVCERVVLIPLLETVSLHD